MDPKQIERPYRLKCTLGDDALVLDSFVAHERISAPYSYVMRLLAHDPGIDTKALLRTPMVLTLQLADGKERHIHGNVSRMKHLEMGEDGMAAYEAEIVPWVWFLSLFTDCKIFQNKNVKDIVEAIFQQRGFTDFRFSLQGSYTPREYCVQYRETDLNFISRLLEDEGIYYYFEQTKEKVTMVLVDAKETLVDCPHDAEAKFMPSSGGYLDEQTVAMLHSQDQVYVGSAAMTDYDFEKPSTDLYSNMDGSHPGEFYDYPGKHLTKDEGTRLSRIRLEEREARQATVHGDTNCVGFECGYKFKLKDHYRDSLNQEYVIVSLMHTARNAGFRSGHEDTKLYTNKFEAIPASTPYRPPRIALKPKMEGPQTAVVVGKSGEEIWTDKYGRVVVQFFWDRQGKGDENSSCWVRVSQAWAGKKWGAIYTPRIGQEVIVSFLEGDPDRPIITGRVYNADQMPPYDLPAEQTKSTLKSMSSKGQDGFNELRFEDKKGSEQIFLHGEKNLDINIKNDRMESIFGNRSLTVEKNKYEKIKGNDNNHVVGNQNEKVEGNHSLEVTGTQGIKITGAHSIQVTGAVLQKFDNNHHLNVAQNVYIQGMQIVIEAQMAMTLKVGSNFITIDAASGIAISGMPLVLINSGGAAIPGTPGMPVTLTPPDDPTDADKDNPGGATSPPSPNNPPPKNMSLLNISPATPEPEEPEEPARSVPLASVGGAQGLGTQELATFPKDIDGAAIAEGLKNAAKDGVPFCEECEKARQEQS